MAQPLVGVGDRLDEALADARRLVVVVLVADRLGRQARRLAGTVAAGPAGHEDVEVALRPSAGSDRRLDDDDRVGRVGTRSCSATAPSFSWRRTAKSIPRGRRGASGRWGPHGGTRAALCRQAETDGSRCPVDPPPGGPARTTHVRTCPWGTPGGARAGRGPPPRGGRGEGGSGRPAGPRTTRHDDAQLLRLGPAGGASERREQLGRTEPQLR